MLGRAVIVFLVLSIGSSAAYAQSESVAGGRYSPAAVGFEIQFPVGWNRTVINDAYAIVAPADETTDGGSSVVMTVLVADRLETRRIMTSEVGVDSGVVAIYENEACGSLVDEIVSLSGSRVFHTIHECSEGEQYNKTDTYVIFTLTKSIAVSLSATSEAAYDLHVESFRGSLQTVRVDEPIDFRTALEIILGTTNIFTQDIQVESAGVPVKLTAATSSQLSRMAFDEETKTISVALDEQRRSEGHLLIPAHRLLLGPYQVYVNGEPWEDFIVIGDEAGVSQLIDIRYERGAHTIEITGTQVVPEFGIGIAAVMAAVMAAVLVYRQGFMKL